MISISEEILTCSSWEWGSTKNRAKIDSNGGNIKTSYAQLCPTLQHWPRLSTDWKPQLSPVEPCVRLVNIISHNRVRDSQSHWKTQFYPIFWSKSRFLNFLPWDHLTATRPFWVGVVSLASQWVVLLAGVGRRPVVPVVGSNRVFSWGTDFGKNGFSLIPILRTRNWNFTANFFPLASQDDNISDKKSEYKNIKKASRTSLLSEPSKI